MDAYGRDDPIVRHPDAMVRGPGARNIEVDGDHVGLAGHPAVYRHLARLLSTDGRDLG